MPQPPRSRAAAGRASVRNQIGGRGWRQVVAAIINSDGSVAVAYVEFSGGDEFTLVKGWDLLSDAGSAAASGEAVAMAPRTTAGNTALAAALARSARLLVDGEFSGARLVIDVVSDDPFDGGRSAAIRDRAVEAGITINAIPVISDDPIGTFDGRLTYSGIIGGVENAIAFYRRDVIGGPGAFVVEARSYNVFGEALKRKLLRELIASYSARVSAWVAFGRRGIRMAAVGAAWRAPAASASPASSP